MSPKSASDTVGGSAEKYKEWTGSKPLVLLEDRISSQHSDARDEEDDEIRDEGSVSSEADEKRATPLKVLDNTKNVAPKASNQVASLPEIIGSADRSRSDLSIVTVGPARDKIDADDTKHVGNTELQIQEKSLEELGTEALEALRSSYKFSFMSDHELTKNLDDIIKEDDRTVYLEVKESESTQMISNIKQDLYAKARRYHPSIREAMLNVELQSKKAELELGIIELERRRVEAELTCMLDNDDDDESDDGLLDIIEAGMIETLSSFCSYVKGNTMSSTDSVSTKGSTIYTKECGFLS